MILRSVELENFGRFKGESIEFRRGMNLVIGPNEAGKSTLAETVPAVLFGSECLEKYKPWGRNACSATLFFEGGGRTIKVKRNLLTDEVELVEKDDMYHVLSQFAGKAPLRGRSASCREYRELVAKLLGVGDDKLFRATYFFGHYPQEWSGDDLSQNLRTLVSGTAEADYAEILDELLDEHFQLTCSNPWGRDKQKPREYEEVCAGLEQADETGEPGEAEVVPFFVEIDETADLAAQIETLTGELIGDRLEHEKGVRYIEQVRRRTVLNAQRPVPKEAPPSKKTENIKEAEPKDIASQLAAVGLPTNLPKELPDVLAEATEIRQEMAELQQPYSLLNSREKRIPTVPWAILCAVICLCAVAVGAAWWKGFYAAWLSLVAGVAVAACCGYGGWKQAIRQKGLAECKTQRNRLDQKKLAAQAKQNALSERCEALGLPSSPIDLVRLQKLVTTHQDLLDRFWHGGNAQEAETVQPQQPDIEEEVAEEDSEVSSTSEELVELESRMAEFETGLKEKESRLNDLKNQLAALADRQPSQLSAGKHALFKRKRELEDRIAILRKSINLLATAVDEFGSSHLVKLTEEAGKLFGKITSGRYNEIKLDENMLPSVRIDSRRWVSIDSLSRGTVDAIYLALRVALAKVRDDGRSLPLMLDDPFVHLDQGRLAKALNMIDMASADGQLILFSHNMDLGKRAARERWHVVPMAGDSVDTSPEEGDHHAGQLHLL